MARITMIESISAVTLATHNMPHAVRHLLFDICVARFNGAPGLKVLAALRRNRRHVARSRVPARIPCEKSTDGEASPQSLPIKRLT
jgi:hypothetical protein